MGIRVPTMSTIDKDAIIKKTDMSETMQQKAVEVAKEAMQESTVEKDIAASIKRKFDAIYSPTWHCIVGRSFGSFVTHEGGNFAYFYMRQNKQAVLLFKAG